VVNLKDSHTLVDQYITQRDDTNMQVFVADTMRLAEIIGATSFFKLLSEINQLFIYKEEYRIIEYIPLYEREWNRVKKEIGEYLKR